MRPKYMHRQFWRTTSLVFTSYKLISRTSNKQNISKISTFKMVPKLPQRQLGKNGPTVTALGFGAMGLSAFYGKPEADEVRFKVLDRAYELGETNWDSADIYMDNEDLIGKWFKRTGKRDEVSRNSADKHREIFCVDLILSDLSGNQVRKSCKAGRKQGSKERT